MDINSLYNITSGAVANAVKTSGVGVKPTESEESSFSSFLNTAIENISTTNAYLSDAENEEIKLAMGLTDNTHDLTVALQKAQTALQYTVAVRDKVLEAYKELMQINI
ncbi:MAG: flagellar hook-basal body complex protein FliE [Lachnospiraceae bacterium]|jgi:flagellar hook-basal body complex protein FliE|nr:flagellar hook-basal body complex protein FliE [Lachnospiraceae bacterium]